MKFLAQSHPLEWQSWVPNPDWPDSKALVFHTILKAAQIPEQNVLGIPASQLSPKSPAKRRGNPFRTFFSRDQKEEYCFEGKAFPLKQYSVLSSFLPKGFGAQRTRFLIGAGTNLCGILLLTTLPWRSATSGPCP